MAEKFLLQKQGITELDETLHSLEFSRTDKVSWPTDGLLMVLACGIYMHHLFPFSSPGKEKVTNYSTLSFLAKKCVKEVCGNHRENFLPHAA